MADHRRHRRSAPQIDHAPERAQQSGDDRGVVALKQVAGAECHARHDDADGAAAEPPRSGAGEMRAGSLRARRRPRARRPRTATRREASGSAPAADCARRVQRRREVLRPRGSPPIAMPAPRGSAARPHATSSATDATCPESTSRGRSPCDVQKQKDQPDQHTVSTSDSADDEADAELRADIPAVRSRAPRRGAEGELSRKVGAEEHFEDARRSAPRLRTAVRSATHGERQGCGGGRPWEHLRTGSRPRGLGSLDAVISRANADRDRMRKPQRNACPWADALPCRASTARPRFRRPRRPPCRSARLSCRRSARR